MRTLTIKKTFTNTHVSQLRKEVIITLGQIKKFIKKKVTKKNVLLFFHKYPRILNYGSYLLLLACFGFIVATLNELSSLKMMTSSAFIKPYCSYNFPHSHTACISFIRGLTGRYLYDAGRFLLAPFAILVAFGIYKVHFEEKLKKHIKI